MKTLTIAGQRGLDRAMTIAQGQLEPARAFWLKRRIAQKIIGEKTIEIEEGGLGDPFTVGAGDRKAATDRHQQGRTNARRVLEAVEDIAADREIAGQRLRFGAPFEGQGFVVAAAILVRLPAIDGIARVKRL